MDILTRAIYFVKKHTFYKNTKGSSLILSHREVNIFAKSFWVKTPTTRGNDA